MGATQQQPAFQPQQHGPQAAGKGWTDAATTAGSVAVAVAAAPPTGMYGSGGGAGYGSGGGGSGQPVVEEDPETRSNVKKWFRLLQVGDDANGANGRQAPIPQPSPLPHSD